MTYIKEATEENKLIKTLKGFTLIELLVTISIIAILGAIGLPNYLSQTSKARGAEGKSNLSTINRAQQVYRFQNGRMANNVKDLESRVSAKFYTYTVSASDRNNASATAILVPTVSKDLRNFSAAVTQVVGVSNQSEFFGSIICETIEVNSTPSPATAPTSSGTLGSCDSSMTIVK